MQYGVEIRPAKQCDGGMRQSWLQRVGEHGLRQGGDLGRQGGHGLRVERSGDQHRGRRGRAGRGRRGGGGVVRALKLAGGDGAADTLVPRITEQKID